MSHADGGAPASGLMHRLFLAPLRTDVDHRWAHEHWTTRHSAVFGRTPGLRGYTQNRPPADAWSGRALVCSETWFDDRAAERAAFESDYYLTEVAADEARFVRRDAAWLSAVTVTATARQARTFRVLVFGHTPESAADLLADWDSEDVDVLILQREPPLCGRRSALGLWTDELTRATGAAVHFGPLTLLTRPFAVVPAPEPPWTPARSQR